MKLRRGQSLETRYAYVRQNAKTLTLMLEFAAARFSQIAQQLEPDGRALLKREPFTPSELRELSSECQRIASQCGIQERGR